MKNSDMGHNMRNYYDKMNEMVNTRTINKSRTGGLIVLVIFIAFLILAGRYAVDKINKKDNVISKNIENVWIKSAKDGNIILIDNGVEVSYKTRKPIENSLGNVVADIEVKGEEVTKLSVKPDTIKGRVKAIGSQYIEIEEYGKVELKDKLNIYTYDNTGDVKKSNISEVNVGDNNNVYVLDGSGICAVLINGRANRYYKNEIEQITDKTVESKNVRVLIMTDNSSGINHKEVTLKCDKPMIVTYEADNKTDSKNGVKQKKYSSKTINSGEVFSASESDLFDKTSNNRISVSTNDSNGRISITSLEKYKRNILYRGVIEILKDKDGFKVINDIDIEQYLYGCVPSEMPESFGIEALKVQAICARTYAYRQLSNKKYQMFGANMDDSTNFQVYNNQVENKTANKAVKDTAGKVIKDKNGALIEAMYYSTSCGYTAEIAKEYETFKAFIEDKDTACHENDCAWFRWEVLISADDMEKNINNTVAKMSKSEDRLKVLSGKEYLSKKIDTIGKLRSIEEKKRNTNGILEEIVIKGSKQTIKVSTQNAIRKILAPIYDSVIKNDVSKMNNMKLLPSAYAFIEKKDNDYRIYGGGFGHGKGMSQCGAQMLAKKGYKYSDIIKYYYSEALVD